MSIEILKLFRRPRSYIGFLAVIVILLLIEAGLFADGKSMLDVILNNLRDNFYLQGNLLNGYLVTYFALNTLWIHIPILIVIVIGDMVSGEAVTGTFRLILARPVSRINIITSKYVASLLYTLILMGLMAMFSLGLGIIIFGKGDLIVLIKGINIIPSEELPWRFTFAFIFGILSMWTVTSLSFLFSCLSENSISPILASMAVIILFTILSNFEISIFDKVKPYLFTTYMAEWRSFFNFQVDTGTLLKSTLVLGGHMAGFYALSVFVFSKKDITS